MISKSIFKWSTLLTFMPKIEQASYATGSLARLIRAKLGFAVNRKLIRFAGIQRSGNHALINWIIAQESSKTCFINGVYPGINPWEKNWGISYPNFPYWPRQRDQAGALVSKDLMICSYENRTLETISNDQKELAKYIGRSRETYNTLILRDPYNTFASYLKFNKPITQDFIELWKTYAREFLGITNFMTSPKVVINFNAWFSDQVYRHELAKNLGLTFTDRGLSEVSHHGGGSSFDGQRFRGEPKKMNVLTRFHYYLNNPEFQAIFDSDSELRHLSEQIFGPPPMPVSRVS
ncbi:MAG: hypothetical protein ACFB0C_24115 [Leptolyngbyaceae cyanobacterium]